MPQQQISAGKAPGALWALERLLLCVGALVALQVLQAGKRPCTGAADVRSRLVGLGRRKGGGRFRVHRNGGFGGASFVSHSFSTIRQDPASGSRGHGDGDGTGTAQAAIGGTYRSHHRARRRRQPGALGRNWTWTPVRARHQVRSARALSSATGPGSVWGAGRLCAVRRSGGERQRKRGRGRTLKGERASVEDRAEGRGRGGQGAGCRLLAAGETRTRCGEGGNQRERRRRAMEKSRSFWRLGC
jgi:hypothetical protein